jgi:hypothetical protein
MGIPRSQRIPNKEFTWKDSSDEEYVGANPNRAMAGRLGIAALHTTPKHTYMHPYIGLPTPLMG